MTEVVPCNLCWKKAASQTYMGNALVCKGCQYDLDRTVNFLRHYGVQFQIPLPGGVPTGVQTPLAPQGGPQPLPLNPLVDTETGEITTADGSDVSKPTRSRKKPD